MICNDCKTENKEGAKFCANCGKDLTVKAAKETKEVKETKKETSKKDFVEMLKSGLVEIKNNLLKPLDSMKSKSSEDIKSVAIIGCITTLAMMLVNLVTSMINACHVKHYDFFKGTTYEWTTKGLKNLDFFDLTIKYLFNTIVVMLIVAFIFYVGSLIVKKSVKFQKIVAIILVAMIPTILGNMIIVPVLALIHTNVGVVAGVLSTIYAITIFATLINEELKLEGTVKLYYNTICYSIVILSAYFYAVSQVASAFKSLGL